MWKKVEMKNIESTIKEIEVICCNHAEKLVIDDPIEEEYFAEYTLISGATEDDFAQFENKFHITLPDDFKELYRYKNGSSPMTLLFPITGFTYTFELLSLSEMEEEKKNFQNRDALLTEFDEYISETDIKEMADPRIKPYLYNKQWFPFAVYSDRIYLMLDFDPAEKGNHGQIICYIHDPDEIKYVALNITDIIKTTLETIKKMIK